MGDLEVVEEEETVVHGVVAEFWTDVSYVYTIQWLMCLQIPNLHNEWVWSVRLSVKDQLGHDDGVGCCAAEGTDPPLGGGEVWRVNNEGLVGWIPCGGSLETADVGAVTELGLGVAADVFVGFSWLEEELLLLLGGLVLEGGLRMMLAESQLGRWR